MKLQWLLVVVTLAACMDGEIAVHPESSGDYGRVDLMKAVEELSRTDRSPAAYRRFAVAVAALEPSFDEVTGELAERNLVFLAVPSLAAWHDRPLDEQLEALALTVWPTALEVDPQPGEAPRAYLERVCRTDEALTCKALVPEAYPVALGALVLRRFRDRARDAMSRCLPCRKDPAYEVALDKLKRMAGDRDSLALRKAERGDPGRWPVGDANARPWSDAPLFQVDEDGKARFRGIPVTAGSWRTVLRDDRRDAEILGVLLGPDDRVSVLRQIMRDARAAGFAELALQVRGPEHPYPLREYRLALAGKRGRRDRALDPRDVDTIQILVQMLDVAMSRGDGPLRLP